MSFPFQVQKHVQPGECKAKCQHFFIYTQDVKSKVQTDEIVQRQQSLMLPLCSSERSGWTNFDEGRASRRRKAGTATVEVCNMRPEDSAGTTEQAARPS